MFRLPPFGRWLSLVTLLCCAALAAHSAVVITADGSGGYNINTSVYFAHVANTGYLNQLTITGESLLSGQFYFGPNASTSGYGTDGTANQTLSSLTKPTSTTVRAVFSSGGTLPEVTYLFSEGQFTVSILNYTAGDGWGMDYKTNTSNAQAATLINLPDMYFDTYTNGLPLQGTVHAYNGITYTYASGATMRMNWASGWGNGINPDENGSFSGYCWARPLLTHCTTGNQNPYNYDFILTGNSTSAFAGPSFTIAANDSTRVGNIFNATDTKTFKLTFPAGTYTRVAGQNGLTASYTATDYFGTTVETGSTTLNFPASGTYTPTFTLTNTKKGWFKLAVTVSGGPITQTSTVKTTYSVITNNAALYGNVPLSASADRYDEMLIVGTNCIRGEMNLGGIFPDAGTTNWTNADGEMNALTNKLGGLSGVGVCWLIDSIPGWLQNNPTTLQAKLQLVLSRYRTWSYNGKTTTNNYWILLNEPDGGFNINNVGAYVTNYLAPMSAAAAAVDSNIKVLGPDTCGIKSDWLGQVYANGGVNKIGALDLHSYPGHHRSFEEENSLTAVRDWRKVMIANGDGGKEIWNTEFGYQWDLGWRGVFTMAKQAVRDYALLEYAGIARNHFYYFYPDAHGFIKFYYFEGDKRMLPLAVSLRVQNEILAGRTFYRNYTFGKNIQAMQYNGSSDNVVMAWSNDFATSITVGTNATTFRVTDIMGNEIQNADGSGNRYITVNISGDPVYIRYSNTGYFTPVQEGYSDNYLKGNTWTGSTRQMLANPGMESDLTSWSPAGTWTIRTDNPHSGTKYAYCANTNGNACLTQRVSVTAGTSYYASVWAKATTADKFYLEYRIDWRDSGGNFISRSSISYQIITGDWKLYQGYVTAPANAVYGDLCPYYFGATTRDVCLDDLNFHIENAPAAGPAFSVDRALLTGKTLSGEVTIDGNNKAYRYDGTSNDVLAIWSVSGITNPVSLTINTATLKVYDQYGAIIADQSGTRQNRTLALNVGADVLYVKIDTDATITVNAPTPLPLYADAVSPTTELFTNPGLENDFTGWSVAGTMSIATTNQHGGAKCAYASDTNGNRALYQRVAVTQNQIYTLGAWLRSTTTNKSTVEMRIDWWSTTMTYLGRTSVSYTGLTGDWRLYQGTATAPTGAVWADPQAYIFGGADKNVYIDDLSFRLLTQVTASSSTTNYSPLKTIDGGNTAENTGNYENTGWQASDSIQTTNPAWLEYKLPQRQNVNCVYIYAPGNACGMVGLRSFTLKGWDYATGNWRTLSTVSAEEVSWTFKCTFASITTDRLRLEITDVNNGWYLGDKTVSGTDLKPRVIEIEAYEKW